MKLVALLALCGLAFCVAVGGAKAQSTPPPASSSPSNASTNSGTSAASPVALTAEPGDEARTLDFGENRDPETMHLSFAAASALSSPPKVVVSDLRTSDGKLFTGSLDATTSLPDPRTLVVALTIDPKDAASGDYAGSVVVRGSAVSDARSSLTVKLAAIGWSDGAAWFVAILSLGLGAAIGLFLKWLGDTGAKLQDLLGQYKVLEAATASIGALPSLFQAQMVMVQQYLAQGKAADAETALTTLKQGTSALIKAGGVLDAMKNAIEQQSKTIENWTDLEARDRGLLNRVVAIETDQLSDLISDAWPEPDSGADARKKLAGEIQDFSSFLAAFAQATDRARLQPALALFVESDFDKAAESWHGIPTPAGAAGGGDAGGAAPGVPEAPAAETPQIQSLMISGDVPVALAETIEETPASPSQGTSATLRFRDRVTAHAALLLQIGTAVVLVVVGLVTVFHPETMFRGQASKDILALLAWGLAAGLTGASLTDLAGKISSGSSGTSST